MGADRHKAGPQRAKLPALFSEWFATRGWRPRQHQLALLEAGRAKRSALLIAPTGAGKTLAGFLPSLVDLTEFPRQRGVSGAGVHTLYISPLKALNFLIESFESDIVVMDYRVRGFTRNVRGMKHFIDHSIDSIQNFISPGIQDRYDMVDVNVYQESIFHTKMRLKELDLDTYLFGAGEADLSAREAKLIRGRVNHEISEIFYGGNIQRGA